MTRQLRVLFPGAVYHVFARGNERRDIFRDETDFARFLEFLELGIGRHGWLCHAYCLMDNHYHLLIETPRANLPQGMRHLNGCYTQDFNRRRERVGHLFQGRYEAVLIEKETQLLITVRYIARNPLVKDDCDRPQDWRWSSYPALIGDRPAPAWLTTDWLLGQFGATREQARRQLRSYVEGDEPDTELDIRGVFLGSDEFIREQTSALNHVPEVPRAHWQPLRPPLASVFETSEQPITTAYRDWGYTMREIAHHLGCHYSTISRRLKQDEQAA